MKRTIAFLSALAMTAAALPIGAVSAEGFAKGDVDMDGMITGRDAAMVSQYADGVLKLDITEEQLGLADVNSDGIVDQSDAAMISNMQQYMLGDVDMDGIMNMADATITIHMYMLNKLSLNIDFGEKLVLADVDCDGDVDAHDAHCMMEDYAAVGASNPRFEEGKYYSLITEEKEKAILAEGLEEYRIDADSLEEFVEQRFKDVVGNLFDVNSDGEMSISDAAEALSLYAEAAAGISGSADINEKADINLDGIVDIEDATAIMNSYAMSAAGLM